ncbi:MAG: CRISPR-associated protein Cas4 [Anaerolineae bacterium]
MFMLNVSDLRQYTYCPRIVYYHYCLPNIRPVTYKMEAGKAAQETEEDREQRRSLRVYGLTDGEREFNVWLESPKLGLRGRVDMIIRLEDEIIPVEYKNSPGRGGKHVDIQLGAYGLLLEEKIGLPARRGFIYFIPERRAQAIPLTAALTANVRHSLQAIREMIQTERMPAPPARRAQCAICEFRRFCNDVV